MKTFVQIISIFLVFFYFQFFPQQTALAPPAAKRPYYEVIAVPKNQTNDQLKQQLTTYIQKKKRSGSKAPIIVGVPQLPSMPLYTPLPFYQPKMLRYVARDNGRFVTFFNEKCPCEPAEEIAKLKFEIGLQRIALEKTLVMRTALYHYFLEKKQLPARATDLLGAFPHNYLSRIPFQQPVHSGSSPALENTGVIYNPALFNPARPWDSLKSVLRKADLDESNVDLEPLKISVYQSSFRMVLSSGSYTVRSYPIGLGADNKTPVGTYRIVLKVSNPLSQSKVYGTRGLVLSDEDYAIHGTNDETSIGKAISKGCIRLRNRQMEELYSMASLGTKVTILNGQPAEFLQPTPPEFQIKPRSNEENPGRVYHWKN
ncbi:L,D-transpeptidase [Aneurinibacillus tyrosinisolvens]|uniref:L,D-transpeptidase n=1 Tax=Aneurinibacillus tyrosinisolvens TaxID=1443435 RepID=UPI00069BE94C|nr:L,D-transpeptidase [Aneurinibacillus tyrosinisolvens]